MKAKTAGLMKFIGPLVIAGGCYAGYTVISAAQQGSIHFGMLMGPKPLYTKAHEPDQFNILLTFLGFDAVAALVAGSAMAYFGYFKKPDDDPAPPAGNS